MKNESDLWIYISIFSGVTFVTMVSVYPYIKRYINFKICTLNDILSHYKQSILLFLPQVATLLYLQVDKVMLKFITNETNQVSFYDQAEKIVQIPLALITALGVVMMPRLAVEYKRKNKEAINNYINKTIIFALFFAFPMTFGIIAISPALIPWYLGTEFTPVVSAIIIISPIIVLNTLTNISGTQYFTATNQTKILTISYSLAAIINIISNIILINIFGFKGAAISTLLSSTISVFIQYIYLNKQINIWKTLISGFRYLIYAGIMGAFVYAIGILIGVSPLTTIIQVVIGLFIYFIVLILTKDEMVTILLYMIKNVQKKIIMK